MRLLHLNAKSDGFELTTFTDETPPYAILSHTWSDGEITYDELLAGTGNAKDGYAKILFCVKKAAEDGLKYSWIDTCCINKSTSDELSAAINSMFTWYQRATKCYVYLPDVDVPEEITDAQAFRITWIEAFRQSRWFTRGWTLQELIAPAQVEFFSKSGKKLGSKISLEKEIYKITEVPIAVLRGQPLSEFSFKERISWAAKRTTTVKEDKAYCLLGIFGVFMPLIYGEGEEHALSRLRKEANIRNPQSQQKNLFNVPFRRDSDFVVRGDILKHVEERCSRQAGRAALVGFGGFGKSQIAIEYAHRVRQRQPDTSVFWVHASNSGRLEQAFDDIAQKIGLSSQPDAAKNIIPAVCRWLSDEANGRWLMIVDNVDDEVAIESRETGRSMPLASLLPQSSHGAILITSRNTDVARRLVDRQQDIIQIGAMSDSEAAELLQNKLGEKPSDSAIQLANALDCIPLAMVQAAAYINRLRPRMSVPKYLSQLTGVEKQVELLRKTTPDMRRDGEALNSVLATWRISFEHIHQQRQSAADLLSFMSFFNPQNIPEFMIRHYRDHKEEQGFSLEGCADEENDDFEEDVAILRAFSLVDTKQSEDQFEMHRLVQLATGVWLKSADKDETWRRAFIIAMAQEFPVGEFENWPKCQILFPHVVPVVEQKEMGNCETDAWAKLLDNTGAYAWRKGLFGQAKGMLSRALDIRRQLLGGDHPRTLISSTLLASVLADQGKYLEAEVIYRPTLATMNVVLGVDHPVTLACTNNFASLLTDQGQYLEAEFMHRKILAIRQMGLGIKHLETLGSMNNLAIVLGKQGKNLEAEFIHRKTVAIRETVLGVDHPETLASMNHLAVVLGRQGIFLEAEGIHRKTLEIKETVLGVNHPDTLASMSNLAIELAEQGKYLEAELLFRKTLAMRETVLGTDHPLTLRCLYGLAEVLGRQCRYGESTELYEMACAGYDTVLGKDHPETRSCYKSYVEMRESQAQHQTGTVQSIQPDNAS